MAVTIKDLEQALINADKAGDVASARLIAAEISKIQSAQQPADGNIFSGAGKRIRQMGEGLTGVGLRVGEAVGAVSPQTLADYEQRVREEQSVMSPTYQQTSPTGGAEIVGSTGVDVINAITGGLALKAAKNVPVIGGIAESAGNVLLPTTVPQAAAGGALYSLTTPSESAGEMFSKAGVGGATGGLTQFGLRQVGLAPQLPSQLTEQQKEVARRALSEGFVLDPTQITGIGQEVKEGIKRNVPLARRAFTRLEDANQEQTNTIAKSLVNIPKTQPLTNETMQAAYDAALSKYKSLEAVPSLQGSQTFVNLLDAQIKKLRMIPAKQRTSQENKAISILNEYKKFASKPITGEEAFIRAKAIGDNLFKAQKEGSRVAADAFKALRTGFEDSIENYLASPANLMRKNGNQVLSDFRSGRKTLSDWYLIKDAFNEQTGNISAARLAKQLAKKPGYGTKKTPIETAAMLSGAFPKAFPSSGTVEGQSFRMIADIGGLAATPITYGLTSSPVRNVLAQRFLGAEPSGIIGNIYGGVAGAGRYLPEPARSTFGRALMSAEQQLLNQELTPRNFGLLGE